MHLLNTDTFELVDAEKDIGYTPLYAILSHRWLPKELEYKDYSPAQLHDIIMTASDSPYEASAQKIWGACAIAKTQQLQYIWIDSLCIDKSSSEELRKALNSMFAWYHEAAVCYAYLSDVNRSQQADKGVFDSTLPHRREQGQVSEWFERGWTLQELLAPKTMTFYDVSWNTMGTKHDLAHPLGLVTGIDPSYLSDQGSQQMKFREASVATKMRWMAGRTTREVEDIAYSLLGIFNVSITPRYGEGISAFMRLQESILTQFGAFDESLFAWETPRDGKLRCYRKRIQSQVGSTRLTELSPRFNEERWGLLAPSPDCFQFDIIIVQTDLVSRLGAGFQQSHQGISFSMNYTLTVKPLTGRAKKELSVPLNCWTRLEGQEKLANIVVELAKDASGSWIRTDCKKLEARKGEKVRNTRTLEARVAIVSTISVRQPQLQLDWIA